jgi:ribosomal protein S4
MRFINKYKKYNKIKILLRYFPKLKFLKFKRSKWQKLKLYFKKKFSIKRKIFSLKNKDTKIFFNHFDKVVPNYSQLRTIPKVNKNYKNALLLKQSIFTFNDQSISLSFFKKILKKEKVHNTLILGCLIKPFFRLDIILWRLNFFSSIYSARQAIFNGSIEINFQKNKSIKFLKKGDIITMCYSSSILTFKFIDTFFFLFPFLELDVYTNTIVIIKNISELTNKDLYLLINAFILFPKFTYYIKSN